MQKRKMEFTPRAAKYSMYTAKLPSKYVYFHAVSFQFFATVLAYCILNKCDIINNNAKQ